MLLPKQTQKGSTYTVCLCLCAHSPLYYKSSPLAHNKHSASGFSSGLETNIRSKLHISKLAVCQSWFPIYCSTGCLVWEGLLSSQEGGDSISVGDLRKEIHWWPNAANKETNKQSFNYPLRLTVLHPVLAYTDRHKRRHNTPPHTNAGTVIWEIHLLSQYTCDLLHYLWTWISCEAGHFNEILQNHYYLPF